MYINIRMNLCFFLALFIIITPPERLESNCEKYCCQMNRSDTDVGVISHLKHLCIIC